MSVSVVCGITSVEEFVCVNVVWPWKPCVIGRSSPTKIRAAPWLAQRRSGVEGVHAVLRLEELDAGADLVVQELVDERARRVEVEVPEPGDVPRGGRSRGEERVPLGRDRVPVELLGGLVVVEVEDDVKSSVRSSSRTFISRRTWASAGRGPL